MTSRAPVAAIVVTYNSGSCVRSCVESLLGQGIPTVVVDNDSADGTLDQLPVSGLLSVIANPQNLGFAAAVNQGVRGLDADNYLLLNPDAQLVDPVAPLLCSLGANGHSAAAGLLVDAAGEPQKGFSFRRLPTPAALAFEVLGLNRIWPGNPVNRRYRCLDADLHKPQTVEQPAGAFLLFRRDVWERLGGFDEGFFPVWFEDVDFCKRILDSGGTIWFDPSVRARHEGGHSVQKVGVQCRLKFWYGSLLRYAAVHYARPSRCMVALCVLVGIAPRALVFGPGVSGISLLRTVKFIWGLAWQSCRGVSPMSI